MGFVRGVITGVAVAAGAAALYMSRAGSAFRDRYRVDRRLGELGDEIELRTREVRASVAAQMDRAREGAAEGSSTLDGARAAAAEEAAELAADIEAKAAKLKGAAGSTEADAEAG
jgi:hypothetical protein